MRQMLLWMIIAFSWMTVGLACSCSRHTDKQYCKENIVFRGRAVADSMNTSQNWEDTEDFDFFGTRTYTVQVDQIFWSKKNSSAAMTMVYITTPNNDGMCGEEFALNTTYVIAASYEAGNLTTDYCSGNRNWNGLDAKRKTFFTSGLRKLCA